MIKPWIMIKKYKNLHKLNFYLDKQGKTPEFNKYLKRRIEEAPFTATIKRAFCSPRNPIYSRNAFFDVYNRYQAIFDYIDKNKPRSILEIGCGYGIGAWIMSDLCDDFVALDNDQDTIDVAQQLFPEVSFVCADVEEYLEGIPNDRFDLIVSAFGPILPKELAKQKCREFVLSYKILNLEKKELTPKQMRKGIHDGSLRRLPGFQLSHSTTIVYADKPGYAKKYPLYYLTDFGYHATFWSYLKKYKAIYW